MPPCFQSGNGCHHGRDSQEFCVSAMPSLVSGCVEAWGRSQSCLLWVREAEALPAEVWLMLPELLLPLIWSACFNVSHLLSLLKLFLPPLLAFLTSTHNPSSLPFYRSWLCYLVFVVVGVVRNGIFGCIFQSWSPQSEVKMLEVHGISSPSSGCTACSHCCLGSSQGASVGNIHAAQSYKLLYQLDVLSR